MSTIIQRFNLLETDYEKRFGHGASREAFETMTLLEMISAMEKALDNGEPVPGWGEGLEWSIVEESAPAKSEPPDSMAAQRHAAIDKGKSPF